MKRREQILHDQPDYERIAGYITENPSNWINDEENPVHQIVQP